MWPFRKKKVMCEFDYDKLAEAIVKAQETVEQKKQEEEREKSRFTSGFMSWLVSAVFYVLSAACVLMIISLAVGIWGWCAEYEKCSGAAAIFDHAIELLFLIVIFVFAILLMLLCFFSAREVSKETDKHYLSSLFSGTIGFVALIVAIIALVLNK